MGKICEEIKNMKIRMVGESGSIIVELQDVDHPATRQIVLLEIAIRQDGARGTQSRQVEVRVSETDKRYFRVPEYVDAFMLQTNIEQSRALSKFG